MEITEFKTLVTDYMNRDAVLFDVGVDGKTDKVLKAVNMAKAWAQRTHRFERAKTQVSLEVSRTKGGSLSDCVRYGTDEAVIVRNIIKPFLVAADGTGLVPIDLITRNTQVEKLQQSLESLPIEGRVAFSASGPSFLSLVQHGNDVFVWPWDSATMIGEATTVVMDVVEFLPDYSDDHTTDFFLVECQDWLLYRTIGHLNMFLKEDQRVPIASRVVDDAWEAVKVWDVSLVESCAAIDL